MTACGWTRWPGARRPQAPRHHAEIHLYHPDRAEPDRHHHARGRRAELLKLSQQYGVPIFEDDCYADLIWDGKRPPAIYAMSKNGGVIHIGSFSKSIAPALRVGFIVAPWAALSRMLALKTDAGSGALEQMVLAEYCAPHFAEHVPKLTRGLRAKLDT
jgi:2-aminoadipate transaminase